MKKKYTRAAALVLALLLALSPAASASYAMGDEIHTVVTHLAEGVDYTRQYIWSETYSDLRVESYIDYVPGEIVQPIVAWGDSVRDKQTLSSLAQGIEESGLRVVSGVNGDYFVMATGVPLGMVVTDGVVRSSSSYHPALGFDTQGNAFIGTPNMSVAASFNRESPFSVYGGINKSRPDTYGYVLYTGDFGPDTDHTASGVDVILRPNTDKLGQAVIEPTYNVVIDAGHGGEEHGTVCPDGEGTDVYEKDLNLAVALLVRRLLLAHESIRVTLTRSSDIGLSLNDRAAFANGLGADLFIALHSNSTEEDDTCSGILTFYNKEDSQQAAEIIQSSVCESTGGEDRGLSVSDDEVLTLTTMPAVLLEMGFMSCPEELAKLTDAEYQQLLAQGVVNGILSCWEASLQEETPEESETPEEPEPSEAPVPSDEPTPSEAPAPSEEPTPSEGPTPSGEPEIPEDCLIYTDVPTIGGRISCTVVEVLQSEKSIEIPEGCLVLSINNKSDQYLLSQVNNLTPGDRVDIDVTCEDARWETAVSAIGGMYKMVTEGEVESGLERAQGPRTAVGIREDGSMVFYSVDGRQSGYSVGASMNQVAMRLIELGCVEAICLDGGGSTTIGATLPGEDSFSVVNRPSEGTQRMVTNALFLAAAKTDPGEAERLIVSPSDTVLMAGAQAEFTAVSVDSMGNKVKEYSAQELTFSFPKGAGTLEGNLLTAGTDQGSHALTVTADGLTGTAVVTTVTTPTKFVVYDETTGQTVSSLRLPIDSTFSLKADALFYNLPTVCGDELYTWAVTNDLATVDQQGNLTVGSGAGECAITVTAGEFTASIPLYITGEFFTLENFEGQFETPEGAAWLTIEDRAAYVRYGKQSACFTYLWEEPVLPDPDPSETPVTEPSDTPEAEPSQPPVEEVTSVSSEFSLILTPDAKYLSLWVYSDGSGNTLSALFSDQLPPENPPEDPSPETEGDSPDTPSDTPEEDPSDEPVVEAVLTEVVLTTLDGTGWQQVILPLPEDAAMFSALKMTFTGEKAGGTLWLDQLVQSNQPNPDLNCPTASASVSGGTFSATVLDPMDSHIPAKQITVTYDGDPIEFSLEGSTVTAALPEADGQSHRVSVIAVDASGNMIRASAAVSADSSRKMPFTDMGQNWADSYALYLYDQGISAGVASGSGLLFQPNRNITRGEFALMVARWMELDLTQYSDVELPFADVKSIPTWCLDAVKAMYDLGIMKGSANNGKLYANAQSSLTRAEAMTQLGRILPKGYAEAELTFTDAEDIPDWSREYFALMVNMGIISGYTDGSVGPTNSILRCEIAKILYAMR